MRLGDLIFLPLAALWQQKVRTFLTTLGVVFGSFVLAASLSVGQGVQNTIARVSHRSDLLRKVSVSPAWNFTGTAKGPEADISVPGEMSEEQRDRIRPALIQKMNRESSAQSRVPIDQAILTKLKALDHVAEVVPTVWMSGSSYLNNQSQSTIIASAKSDNSDCQKRLIVGRLFDPKIGNSVVIDEFLLYRLGLIDFADRQAAVGKTLRLEFATGRQQTQFYLSLVRPDGQVKPEEQAILAKIQEKLPNVIRELDWNAADQLVLQRVLQETELPPESPITLDCTIAGVLRLHTAEEENAPWDPTRIQGEVVLPAQAAADLYFRVPEYASQGLMETTVVVDDESHSKEVAAKIKELGLEARAPLEYIERERLMYLMIFGAMTCVAAVAMFVAALGIANTMLMSVLERTREIGIMKAVGAGNGILQFLFLTEGALIGILGGAAGLLLAWIASFPGDAWVRSMVSRDMKIELEESIFVFPYWLSAVVLTFAVLVTTLAAVMPARRAARIDPVKALRHE